MTNEEIDAMLPGKELDALIHREVFGRKTILKKGKKIGTQHSIADGDVDIYTQDYYIDPDDTTLYLHVTDGYTGMIPHYSTSISDAWKIVESFRGGWNKHTAAVIGLIIADDIDTQDCECIIYAPDIEKQIGIGREMPEAICRCALKVANCGV